MAHTCQGWACSLTWSRRKRVPTSGGQSTMVEYFLIAGGNVYDPANGSDGQVQDLWIADGKIVAPPADPSLRPNRTLDAAGLVVMPGGIDMHCHIAGPKVNAARKMRPEEKRKAEPVRRHGHDAQRHAGQRAQHVRHGLQVRRPGLHHRVRCCRAAAGRPARARGVCRHALPRQGLLRAHGQQPLRHAVRLRRASRSDSKAFVAWLLGAAKGYAPKLVNPGGVEVWKQPRGGNVARHRRASRSFRRYAAANCRWHCSRGRRACVCRIRVHIHCNKLGMPGNWTTTLETMKALEGHAGHITHIQFHSYGGGEGDENTFNSQGAPLADYVNRHPNVTVDVGQVLFGETTSMTGDGPLGYYLAKVYGAKWFSCDTEMEAGCGIAPIEYRNKSLVHALQWAIGLEWYLLVHDPWRIAMSTDHPNGGSFLAYPQIIRLLMDRAFRAGHAEGRATRRCASDRNWATLTREYTLQRNRHHHAGRLRRGCWDSENKGHLGPGADADITIYTPHENKQTMFEMPRYRDQVGPRVGRTRRHSRGAGRQNAVRVARVRSSCGTPHSRVVRASL